MHFGVAPRAPAAYRCALQWVASIISHSKSGSLMRWSSNFSHMPLSRQRQKRRWVLDQLPYSPGKSRHGAPVRKIHNTALMNWRLSLATPPATGASGKVEFENRPLPIGQIMAMDG